MGPLGLFFARLASHLERRGVPVTKVCFPLREFGFTPQQRVPYAGPMADFQPFLRSLILRRGIRHLFMYGDFIDPHRLAIELVQKMNAEHALPYPVEAWVFELGYIRPNFISLELERVNARSNLNKPVAFYQSLPPVEDLPQPSLKSGLRWRKVWKTPTFIQHAFANYTIIAGAHKLQPKPSYLWYQVYGLLRKYQYRFTERAVCKRLLDGTPFILVPLQVSSDSQISLGSDYAGMEPLIEELISSFASHAPAGDRLAFKHHPRDRGYNHYGALISVMAQRHGVADRVLYFHDAPLGPILKHSKAVVTINSTVGLQALYHGTPTKVLGRTFYNLPGLTDQQPLHAFWGAPQPSDRDLFRRFYAHVIDSTQINGNFDGLFPFAKTFSVAPELALRSGGSRPSLLQVSGRLLMLIQCFASYYLQLLALAIGARRIASRLLEQASRQGLKGMGVRVLMERRGEPVKQAQIHIANHGHPLDVLLVQGHFRECSMTTSARQLSAILPFFVASARNYGHIHLDHLSRQSRLEGLHQLMRRMEERGRLFLFPSGSLVTPITERVSGSLYLLGRRNGALIIPWFITYHGFSGEEKSLRHRPLALMVGRLLGNQATILCQKGPPIDPSSFPDQDALASHIRSLYADRLLSMEGDS